MEQGMRAEAHLPAVYTQPLSSDLASLTGVDIDSRNLSAGKMLGLLYKTLV